MLDHEIKGILRKDEDEKCYMEFPNGNEASIDVMFDNFCKMGFINKEISLIIATLDDRKIRDTTYSDPDPEPRVPEVHIQDAQTIERIDIENIPNLEEPITINSGSEMEEINEEVQDEPEKPTIEFGSTESIEQTLGLESEAETETETEPENEYEKRPKRSRRKGRHNFEAPTAD